MASSPGTVSKILWHFTGGPLWNSEENRQGKRRKSPAKAYKALYEILKSGELRVSKYKELVKVIAPTHRYFDRELKIFVVEKNVPRTMVSAPVCCLADIPIMHLEYHAQRYGKIAIGFHRSSILKHGFNPVFYQLHDSRVLRSIYGGFAQLDDTDTTDLDNEIDNVSSEVDELTCEHDHPVENNYNLFDGMRQQADSLRYSIELANKRFEELLAFVKTFDQSEFGSIYCEREWRSIATFKFNYSDVAMVVLPRKYQGGNYFERFLKDAKKLGVPSTVSLVAWDDLVEH